MLIKLEEIIDRKKKSKDRDVIEKTLDCFAIDYCNATTEVRKKKIDGYAWDFLAKIVEAPENKAIYFSYYQSSIRKKEK